MIGIPSAGFEPPWEPLAKNGAKMNEFKSVGELQRLVAMLLSLNLESMPARRIRIYAVNDNTWRAMSAHYDDPADFRNDVMQASALLAGRYSLAA